jgi:hypothetical protein
MVVMEEKSISCKGVMKRLIKWASSILLLLFFLHSCVYHRITHMNEEELEWIANRHEGEMMYFQSNNGIKDTAIVYNIEIYNSLNPFNMAYFNTSNTEYIAGGCIDYSFNRSTGCVGTLYVQKLYNNKPLFISGGLLGRWSKEIPLKLTTLEVNNVTFNDILFFNEMNTEQITNYNQANPIKSYAWSKKYGLVQYTFQDGTLFSRVLK